MNAEIKKIEDTDMEKPEEMKERIEHILRAKNMTAAEFAECLGIQASGLSHILSGRNNPSLDFVLKLKNAFPEYNLDWIMLGVGPMTGYAEPRPITMPERPLSPTFFTQEESAESAPITDEVHGVEAHDDIRVSEPEATMAKGDLEKVLMVYSDGTFEVLSPRGK